MDKQNMNVEEAADYIGIGKRTLWDLITKNEIRVVKIRHRVILRKKDLDDFMESQLQDWVPYPGKKRGPKGQSSEAKK